MRKVIVIEIKDKDLFTIYDVEHKGVCCCSAYTLKQLLSDHNEVLGCQVVNGKLNVFECDLYGNKRSRKASNCCTDTTKRSAVTIEKGLDEAHYPRLKAERKLDTTALTNETRKIKGVDLHINDVKRFDLNEGTVTGMVLELPVTDSTYSSMKIYSLDKGVISFYVSHIIDIKSTRLTEEKRKIYDRIAADNVKLASLQKQYKSVRDEWTREEQKLREKYGKKSNDLQQEVQKMQMLMNDHINKIACKMSTVLSDDYAKEQIIKSLGNKMYFSYVGDRGYINRDYDNNTFDIYIGRDKKDKSIYVSLVASVDCRESRSYIVSTFGYEEYDGTVDVEKKEVKGKEAEPYFKSFRSDLKNGKKSFFYSLNSDTEKGYFTKNFAYTYEFKGIKELNNSALKKIISEIK